MPRLGLLHPLCKYCVGSRAGAGLVTRLGGAAGGQRVDTLGPQMGSSDTRLTHTRSYSAGISTYYILSAGRGQGSLGHWSLLKYFKLCRYVVIKL